MLVFLRIRSHQQTVHPCTFRHPYKRVQFEEGQIDDGVGKCWWLAIWQTDTGCIICHFAPVDGEVCLFIVAWFPNPVLFQLWSRHVVPSRTEAFCIVFSAVQKKLEHTTCPAQQSTVDQWRRREAPTTQNAKIAALPLFDESSKIAPLSTVCSYKTYT